MSTAVEIRMEECRASLNYEVLSGYPEIQAERIAQHYVNMSLYAVQLLKIIETAKYTPKGSNLDDAESAAQYILKQIKVAHFHDLGIELKWPAKIYQP